MSSYFEAFDRGFDNEISLKQRGFEKVTWSKTAVKF